MVLHGGGAVVAEYGVHTVSMRRWSLFCPSAHCCEIGPMYFCHFAHHFDRYNKRMHFPLDQNALYDTEYNPGTVRKQGNQHLGLHYMASQFDHMSQQPA